MSRYRIPLTLAATCACVALAALPATAQAPLQVGEPFPISIDSRGASDVESSSTATGRVYRISHPGATYIAIHFAEFDLAPGDLVRISDGAGGQSYTLTGKGKMEAGTFWAQHVKGDTALIELETTGRKLGRGFVIDEYAAGFVSLGGPGDFEAICGLDDKENAVCYQSSHPTEYDTSRAVARLLIQGFSLCTGWLASADNHLVTNEHCITSATAALNTDYEFMSEATTCGSTNCQLCYTGDIYSGASFVQDNAALDYALVQISSGAPASLYGFLGIDDRPAVLGEQIYIPQHPGGRAKELGIFSSDPADSPSGVCHVNSVTEPPCSGSGYNDVGYFCDTEGGSSGSPVLATSSHKVIALHHCALCENRGVPITLVCDEICPLLGPECSANGDCDDGDACTTDTCANGSCANDPIEPCCGNDTCELGEDCVNCGADCKSGATSGAVCGNGLCEAGDGEDCVSCPADCNGKQTGKPDSRFCCGDGAGTNPVPCSDSRCSTGGFACTDTPTLPGSYCCGDLTCEGAEDCAICALDCNTGSEVCDDGLDNDCNGATDCADGICASDPICAAPTCGVKNDPCTTNADCCDGYSCQRNGRCR